MTMTTKTATANANLSKEAAPTPLRICCYGSSSSRTPTKYTSAAYTLGNLLAKRGHTCVNGAGSSGCMAAMNHGAHDGHGHIVGVIHEKFVVDGSDWFEGAHSVFREGSGNEILVARGNDLQERKKLLVKDADALVVLPGGPGTWDEVSCALCIDTTLKSSVFMYIYMHLIICCLYIHLKHNQLCISISPSCGKWHAQGILGFIPCQLFV